MSRDPRNLAAAAKVRNIFNDLTARMGGSCLNRSFSANQKTGTCQATFGMAAAYRIRIRNLSPASEALPFSICQLGRSRTILAPAALLTFGGGNEQGFVVGFAGVIVDRGCCLSTEVASLFVEIESAHAVGTVRAGELHAAFDALDSIGFHLLNCSPPRAEQLHSMVRQPR